MVLWLQLRVLLAIFAARAYCWPLLSLLPIRPQVLFSRTAAQPGIACCGLLQRLISSKVWDFTFVLVECHKVHLSPIPAACVGPSGWQPCFEYIDHSSSFVSSVNSMWQSTFSSSKSSTQILNRSGPGMQPYIHLVTDLEAVCNHCPLRLIFQSSFNPFISPLITILDQSGDILGSSVSCLPWGGKWTCTPAQQMLSVWEGHICPTIFLERCSDNK